MDWNNDGKVDFQDSAFFHSEILDGDGGYDSVDGVGCLSWIMLGALVMQVFKWLIEIFD